MNFSDSVKSTQFYGTRTSKLNCEIEMYESQGIPYAKQQYIQSFVCNSYKVQKQLQHMQT